MVKERVRRTHPHTRTRTQARARLLIQYVCCCVSSHIFPAGALEHRLAILQALQYHRTFLPAVAEAAEAVAEEGEEAEGDVAPVCRSSSLSSTAASLGLSLWLGQYAGYSDHLGQDHVEYLTRRDKHGISAHH